MLISTAACALDGAVFEQRARNRLLRRIDGPSLPVPDAGAHDRPAAVRHHGLDIGEIDVHVAGTMTTSEMPLTAWTSTLSASLKDSRSVVFFSARFRSRSFGITISASTFFLSSAMPFFGLVHPRHPFEAEGLCDHAHGKGARLPGEACDHRRRARARAAAHARRDEDHVGSGDGRLDLLRILERRVPADLGIRSRPPAAGKLGTDLELDRRPREFQGLHVGVRDDELNAL